MTAWIKGSPVGTEAAIRAGADLLARARSPVIAGLVCDVDGIRAAYRLAAGIGAAIDPAASDVLYADLAVLASAGAMATTPSEALGRADCVLLVGAAARSDLARALAASAPSRGRAAGRERSLVVVGDEPLDGAPAGGAVVRVPAVAAEVPTVLGFLRALAHGRVAAPAGSAVVRAADRLKGALFGVAVYEAGELGELGTDMLQGLVKDLNAATRFSAVSLADAHQGRTVQYVGAWMAGTGPRVGFGRGAPEHDPWRFDAARLVEAGEADAVLWVAGLPAPQPAWCRQVPCLALLGAADGQEGDVVIAVAAPGETSPGTLWDPHRATLVHRDAARPGETPSAAAILAALAQVTAPEGAASC